MTATCSVRATPLASVCTLPRAVRAHASTARRSSMVSPVVRRTCRASTRPVTRPRPTASTARLSIQTIRTTSPALLDPAMNSAQTPGKRWLARSRVLPSPWMSRLCPPRMVPRLRRPLRPLRRPLRPLRRPLRPLRRPLRPSTISPRLMPIRPSLTLRPPSMLLRRPSMTIWRRSLRISLLWTSRNSTLSSIRLLTRSLLTPPCVLRRMAA